jgi:hypothetical protein
MEHHRLVSFTAREYALTKLRSKAALSRRQGGLDSDQIDRMATGTAYLAVAKPWPCHRLRRRIDPGGLPPVRGRRRTADDDT